MKNRKPIWLIAGSPGGNKQTTISIMQEAFESCKMNNPSVVYIGAASNDDRIFFSHIITLLKKAGAGNIVLAPSSGKRMRNKFNDIISKSDVLFISGGDVALGMENLSRTGVSETIKNAYNCGKLLIGLSAGSIMLGKGWLKWEDPNDDNSAEIFDCLGIAPIYCDTHAEEDSWEELITLVKLLPPTSSVYGLPSGTALEITSDLSIRAHGGVIYVFQKKDGKIISEKLHPLKH